MSIQRFPLELLALAQAIPDPKYLVIELDFVTVYTPPDIPPNLQNDTDRDAVRAYAKLKALRDMTPAEVEAWVNANVNTLAQAKDAIATLAVGVGYLIRSI